jgi:hypothetical protein
MQERPMKFGVNGASVPGLSAGDGVSTLAPVGHMAPLACADHPQDRGGARASDTAETRDLRLELGRLRAERDKLLDTQRQVMELLNSRSPEKILHDLRNALNERELYRAVANIDSLQG